VALGEFFEEPRDRGLAHQAGFAMSRRHRDADAPVPAAHGMGDLLAGEEKVLARIPGGRPRRPGMRARLAGPVVIAT
jgi:hypothetical protein